MRCAGALALVCWSAWYNPTDRYAFDKIASKTGEYSSWFSPYASFVLGPRRENTEQGATHADTGRQERAVAYVRASYPLSVAEFTEDCLTDVARKQDVIICKTCAQGVDLDTGHLKPAIAARLCVYCVDPVTAQRALDDGLANHLRPI